MKYLILMTLISTAAFASERESSYDHCSSAITRVQKIQRELSGVTAELVRENTGPESYSASRSPSASFDCEEVPSKTDTLLSRRDYLQEQLRLAQKERDRACPRTYPE